MPNCGFPKPGASFISRERWGSTDRLCQAVAFRSLENALFWLANVDSVTSDGKMMNNLFALRREFLATNFIYCFQNSSA